MRNSFEVMARAAIPDRFGYETTKLPYVIASTYLPDFSDGDTLIEIKGWMRPACRRMMVAVRSQHPLLRMILCFQRPTTTISKRSRTTYAEWALKNGFEVMTIDQLRDL